MEGELTAIGATGIFIIYLLKTILPILLPAMKSKAETAVIVSSNKIKELTDLVYSSQSAINDLHRWCNVTDQDGVKLIYVRHSMTEALQQIATGISNIVVILDRIQADMNRLQQTTDSIHDSRRS